MENRRFGQNRIGVCNEGSYGRRRTIVIIMYDYTSNNWGLWNCNDKLMEKSGSGTRKTFDRFTTKDSYAWNITHNAESTAV